MKWNEPFTFRDDSESGDSPLYGAMGFVRKSEKKSVLTRKKKNVD